MNTLYGHDRILREYAQVKLPYVLPGELEHGWTEHFLPGVDLDKTSPSDKRRLRIIFNQRNHAQATASGFNVVPIGSPILYMEPENHPETPPLSLLLCPSHSIPEHGFVDPVENAKVYLKAVKPLLVQFHPVAVCLYWFDYQNAGVREVFQTAGLLLTHTLHREDPQFLYHLRYLMQQYRYVSSNQLATSIFYALYWGRIAFTCGRATEVDDMRCFPYDKGMTMPIETIREQEKEFQATMYPELRWNRFDGQPHAEIGRYEVGEIYKRTPEELRTVLGWTPLRFRLPWKNLASQYLPESLKKPLRQFAPALLPLAVLGHFHPYIDPGSGSLVIQAVIGGIVAALMGIKVFWNQIKTFVGGLLGRFRKKA